MTPKKVLVTGASGFIGSRLCERLKLHWAMPYRAMVRSFGKAARIARLDSELVQGDLQNSSSIERAAEGCDTVVHLAYGSDARTETTNLVRMALRLGVARFVHISSMAVHGFNPGPAGAREDTARIGRYRSDYSDAKAAAEEVVQRAIDRDSLPAIILRPTIVYGPHGGFVLRVIHEARTGVVTLIDEGRGICNAVYVDDVCAAIHTALTADNGVGLPYFINGPDEISWLDFNTTFARMVSPDVAFVSVSSRELLDYWSKQQPTLSTNLKEARNLLLSRDLHRHLGRVPAIGAMIKSAKAIGKRVLSPERVRLLKGNGVVDISTGPPPPPPDEGRVSREAYSVRLEIERARSVLQWAPRYDLPHGAAMTQAWLRFARLIPG